MNFSVQKKGVLLAAFFAFHLVSGGNATKSQSCQRFLEQCVPCESGTNKSPCFCESFGHEVDLPCSKYGDKYFHNSYDGKSGLLHCPKYIEGNSPVAYQDRKNCFADRLEILSNTNKTTAYKDGGISFCSNFELSCIKCGLRDSKDVSCRCESTSKLVELRCMQSQNSKNRFLGIYDGRTGFLRCPSKVDTSKNQWTNSCLTDTCTCFRPLEKTSLEQFDEKEPADVYFFATVSICIIFLVFVSFLSVHICASVRRNNKNTLRRSMIAEQKEGRQLRNNYFELAEPGQVVCNDNAV